MELAVTGCAGQSGSRILYLNEETRKKLLDRYPQSFFNVLEKIPESLPGGKSTEASALRPEAGVLKALSLKELESKEHKSPEEERGSEVLIPGVRDCESAAEGGVFGAMWRLLKRNRLGADFNQRKIPVLQQTIEICETFGLDPYRMEAGECAVWLCEDPAALIKEAEEKNIPVSIVGFTAKGPGIRRTDGATVAYLRRPEDETLAASCGKRSLSGGGCIVWELSRL